MTPILENVFLTVLSVSSKAAMMAVVVGLLCLCLRRWIPAGWRHGLWLLVFIRLATPDLGELPWTLPSWKHEPRATAEAVSPSSTPGTSLPPRIEAPLSLVPQADSIVLPQTSPTPLQQPSVPIEEPPAPIPWMLIAAGLWLTGAVAWWTCLVVGWLRFRRRALQTSAPATEDLTRLLSDTLAQAGMTNRLQLRVTDQLHTPAICGWWRPVILLPAEAVSVLSTEKLRLLLLHELGHVRRMDVMVQVCTSLLLGLHWFNPLLWYAHRQLRAEAETATDAWVLERSGSSETRRYGEVLIDLAARCSWMGWLFFLAPSVIGAAESGGSLHTRIRAITTYRRASRWSVLAGVACVAVMIATGMTQSPTSEAAPTTTPEKNATVATDAKDDTTEKQNAPSTNPSTSKVSSADLATPGFLIASENKVVLKAGTTYAMPEPRKDMAAEDIGGVVVDEDGNLVTGAKVIFRALKRPTGYQSPEPVITDAEGRWLMKGVPPSMEVSGAPGERHERHEFKITVTHPDYLSLDLYYHTPSPGPTTADFRRGKAVLILEKGVVMKGRVTDADGKPVANAQIRRTYSERNVADPTTMTNVEGYYELKHARPGEHRMRIEAKDCAVWMNYVDIAASGTWDFKLEPAKKLTVRVQDGKGNPVPKAYVVYHGTSRENHGGGNIAWGTVDAEGKFSWSWTPSRNIAVAVTHRDYQDQTVKVKEESTDVVVTLQPRHRLALKIVDATTGKPVPDCIVERGSAFRRDGEEGFDTAWLPNPPLKADGQGMLEDSLREEKELVAYRITATGYTPLVTRVLGSADSKTTEEVKLQPVRPLTVQILQPDGRPAGGAFVYGLLRAKGFMIEDMTVRVSIHGSGSNEPLEASLEADPTGACVLPSSSDDTIFVVVHESGFAFARWPDVPRGTSWKLGPWARAEGIVREQGKPVAGVEFEYQGGMALPDQHWVSVRFRGISNAEGKVIMPRVFPAWQAHFAELSPESTSRRGFSQRIQDVEMKPTRAGETTVFELTPMATKSWTVTGRLVSESGPIPTSRMPRSLFVDREQTSGTRRSSFSHAEVSRDGTFELGPLTPGEYQIRLWDDQKANFTLNSPPFMLAEPPHGTTAKERRRDLGDVILTDLQSPQSRLEVPASRARFRVTLTDHEGKPLPGANITPVAFRVREESGTGMRVREAVPGLPEDAVRTDASGVAEIECADKTKAGTTLTELQLYVVCEGHIGDFAAFAKANVNTTIALRRAGSVIARVTQNGNLVESDRLRIVSSKTSTDADAGFTRQADGTYVNHSLREGPLQVQAAWQAENGSLLFSKAASVTVALDKPATCELALTPGQRLRGRLDAQVPRPVKYARIGVCVLNIEKATGGNESRIAWQDWQDVREDGTFDFTSLPPGPLRVGVLAEGWMHAYEPNSWSGVRPLDLTAPLPDEVVIPMTRTATCEVLVLGKNDKPLPEITVSASPNISWSDMGNGLLDIHGPTLKQLLARPVTSKVEWEPHPRSWRSYQVTTDASGRATLVNLPAGRQRLDCFPKQWKQGDPLSAHFTGQSDEISLGMTGKAILRQPTSPTSDPFRR